ncbi:hypothetical protein [Nostoc sp. FACHB-133]|nr:hypothetical protein [Nostoc sp. FACHB-133]
MIQQFFLPTLAIAKEATEVILATSWRSLAQTITGRRKCSDALN